MRVFFEFVLADKIEIVFVDIKGNKSSRNDGISQIQMLVAQIQEAIGCFTVPD